MFRTNKILARMAALVTAATLAPSIAPAATVLVDLELALAIDISRSVDEEEANLQRAGYIAAFRHPSIIDAIRHGPYGRIAVTYFEWGGQETIRDVTGWTLIHDKASAEAFADLLTRDAPMQARRTGISGAIEHGVRLFSKNSFKARRRVIDISGDGANNSGDLVSTARDRAVASGVTINGLPIMNGRATFSGWQPIKNLDLYYKNCVIGGPGAFSVVAKDFKDFSRAIMRKLILEIANWQPPAVNPLLIRVARQRIAPPCDIGEQRRRQRWLYDDDDYVPLGPQRRP
jgi:hypothetical protein